MSKAVLTGEFFLSGGAACVEGAIAAGCRFYAGYPITPSSEIAERMSRRLPQVGGHYLQMEDEPGSLAAVLGASWGHCQVMTATSGPGFSLMQENLGLAVMTETPCVIVDVQRGGPSTGLPTLTSQADMMQAKWGSHGDYELIAYAPQSPQEMFDLTFKAFNMAEKFRTPVLVMSDKIVSQMVERVLIPAEKQIKRVERRRPDRAAQANGAEVLVPPMACAGEGFAIHVTGLTHDERGYPAINVETQQRLIGRLRGKILQNGAEIIEYEERDLEGARIVVVAYGSTARSALLACRLARQRGLEVGLLRLITVWPFPAERIKALRAEALIVPECNQGQMVREVERFATCPVRPVSQAGGELLAPESILKAIEEVAQIG
ncbi:MAG TPA: 2-oxoacid:acceptor oxidoreductase subunit alpha [Candidatus Fraserbacteria bacterium]|nr:2-oxoacid:acceptor oxidoreductase subunit alpha [Candidatus Fraserbacteria bacterium]